MCKEVRPKAIVLIPEALQRMMNFSCSYPPDLSCDALEKKGEIFIVNDGSRHFIPFASSQKKSK